MPNVLVRDIKDEVLDALKERARKKGRSLQVELKDIPEQVAQVQMVNARIVAAKIRRSLSKIQHTDSVKFLSDDRER